MIYCDVRALTYYGWCGFDIISWSMLRGETTNSFDAHTDELTHIMLYIDIIGIAPLLVLYNLLGLECLHSLICNSVLVILCSSYIWVCVVAPTLVLSCA